MLRYSGSPRPFQQVLHSPKLAGHLLGVANYFRHDSVVAEKERTWHLVATRQRQAFTLAAQVPRPARAYVKMPSI